MHPYLGTWLEVPFTIFRFLWINAEIMLIVALLFMVGAMVGEIVEKGY